MQKLSFSIESDESADIALYSNAPYMKQVLLEIDALLEEGYPAGAHWSLDHLKAKVRSVLDVIEV